MVLSTLLPARSEFTLRVVLSEPQKQQYISLAREVLCSCVGASLNESLVETWMDSVDLNQRVDSFKGILPALLNLRMLCDRAEVTKNEDSTISTESGATTSISTDCQLKALLDSSSKLQVILLVIGLSLDCNVLCYWSDSRCSSQCHF